MNLNDLIAQITFICISCTNEIITKKRRKRQLFVTIAKRQMKKQFILRCEENGFINFPQAKMPRVTNEFFL